MGSGPGEFSHRFNFERLWLALAIITFLPTGILVYTFEGFLGPYVAAYLLSTSTVVVALYFSSGNGIGVRDRVFGRSRKRLNKTNSLSILRDLGLKINSAFEEKALASVACRSTREVIGADVSLMFTFETENNQVRLRGSDGYDEGIVDRLDRGGMATAIHTIDTQQVLITTDALKSLLPGVIMCAEEGIGSLFCVPLKVGPLKVGALLAGMRSDKGFTEEQVHTVLLLSEQIAMAIRNVQLYERLRRQRNQLQDRVAMLAWLHEATRSLNESLDTVEVLDKILEFVSKACEVEKVILVIPDEKGRWTPRRTVGIELIDICAATATSEDAFIQRLLSGQPVRMDDLELAATGDSVHFHEVLSQLNIRSYLAIPLVHEGKVMGFISVMSPEPQHFSEEQLNILAILSYQAAVALQNAYLFEAANKNKARAEDSARYLKGIIDNLSEGLVVYDEHNRPEVVNPAFHRMFGIGFTEGTSGVMSATNDIGVRREPSLEEIASGSDATTPSIVLTGKNSKIEEIEIPNRNSVIQRISSPLYDELGNTKGKVVVYHDVTDEREGQRARDEFMATVSHELRTPLTAIIGYTDILLKGIFGKMDARQLPYLEKVKFSSRRLLNLINDVLDVSRIQTGRVSMRREWVDLIQVLGRSFSSAAVIAGEKGVRLEWKKSQHELQAWVDQDRLQQVIDNLLGNAIKFTPAGGKVTLRVKRDQSGRSVRVSVTDTGVGIAPEHLPRIFESFYQVDSSSRREYGGTGLGLSIAKSLVELHGGSIKARSQLEKGSVFSFIIPIRPEGI